MMRKYVLYILFLWIIQEASGAELAISTAPNHQLRPSVASSGTNYLTVWGDNRNSSSTGTDIWGRIISIDGIPLDSFPICTLTQNQHFPEVAWGASKYLVTWMYEGSKIYGQFVDINGNLIDATFLIGDGLSLPLWKGNDVESNGDNFLVAWAECPSPGEFDIAGRVIQSDGTPVGPVFTICDVPDTQRAPKVVGVGTNYLIAWADFRTGKWNIYGQRVSPGGTLIGGNFSITPKSVPQGSPALASNDSCVLVAWEEDHGVFLGWDIHGSILDTAMNVLHSDFTISMASWDQRLPCACWHLKTSKFIVGWHDYRDGSADIWIREVNKDASLDSEQKITTLSVEQREPDIACSNVCFLIVWEDYRQGSGNVDVYGYVPTTCPVEEKKCLIGEVKIAPNPFVSFVKFIGIKERIRIYDVQGRFVKELDANQIWYGKDARGREVPSGTYFVYPIRKSSFPIQKIIKL